MKLLIVSSMFPCKRHPTSGIFFANLLKELSQKVDEITLVCPRPYIPKVLTKIKKDWQKWYLDPMISQQDGVEVIRPYVFMLRGISSVGINAFFMKYSLYGLLNRIVVKKKIDIILGFNLIPEGVATVWLAKKLKLPCLVLAIGEDVDIHAKYNILNYYLTKKCLQKCTKILTVSKDLEYKIKALGKDSIPVQTFHLGIDVANFMDLPSKSILIEKLRLNHNKRYILFIGRLIREKGIYELAQAFINISERFPDIDLILLGEEFKKDFLIRIFNEAGVLDRITFTGIIPYKQVAYYMKVSDLLVLPSWNEGLPNCVLEAMCSRIPVVASNVGGIPEALENEVTGLSVPPKNVEKLTQAIIRMLSNNQLRMKCVDNGEKLVFDKFDVKKNALEFYYILNDLVRKKK
jgi:teichuronic acid biosynthesis glycosyltransferase TuaC